MSARRKLRLLKPGRRPANLEWRVGKLVPKESSPRHSITGGSPAGAKREPKPATAKATVLVDLKRQARNAAQPAGQDHLSLLRFVRSTLRGLTCKAAREDVELALADLTKDIRARRDEGCSERHIGAFVLKKSLGVIVPIVWDAMWRWGARVLLIVEWIRKLRGN